MIFLKRSEVDFKSVAIGVMLCITVALLLAATNNGENDLKRYRCCGASGDPQAVFVVDAYSGHTWRFDRSGTIDYGTPFERESLRTSVTPKR